MSELDLRLSGRSFDRHALAQRRQSLPAGQAALRMITVGEAARPLFNLMILLAEFVSYAHAQSSSIVLGALCVLNLVILLASLAHRGPFTFGWIGIAFEVVHVLGAVVVIGWAMPRMTYLSVVGGGALGNYEAPLAAFLTLYPRPSIPRFPGLQRLLLSPVSDLLLPMCTVPAFVAAALINGYPLHRVGLSVLGVTAGWGILGVATGYTVWIVARFFADSEAENVRASYRQLERWLHSELRGDMASLRQLVRSPGATTQEVDDALRSVDIKIQGEGLRLLLEVDRVSAATVLSHHVKRFRAAVHFAAVPAVGELELPRPGAALFDRILGDLLSNVVKAHAANVWLDVRQHGNSLILHVADDGPGFGAGVLTDPACSLGVLAADLSTLGGFLARADRPGGGSVMTADIRLDA